MTTYSSQPDSSTGNDTAIAALAATTNYGNAATLYVGEEYGGTPGNVQRTLIKFDLSSIPAAASITSATLYLTIKQDLSNNSRNMKAYRLKRNWTETGATWNTYDGSNNWQTAGATGANDYDSASMGTLALTGTESVNTEKSISLTTTEVKKMIDGTYTNYGWLLMMDTETDDMYAWYPCEDATASYRPRLVIEYTAGVRVTSIF
jgi:hypothetical protein